MKLNRCAVHLKLTHCKLTILQQKKKTVLREKKAKKICNYILGYLIPDITNFSLTNINISGLVNN